MKRRSPPYLTPEFVQKAEQLSITQMILEQWKAGKIKRSPENILALLADF